MKRRRFIETSVGAGFALSTPRDLPHDLLERFESQEATGATATLALLISELRYEDLSLQAVAAAKVGILDGVAVMLAGSTFHPLASVMAGYVKEMGGTPRCSVVGWGFRTSAPSAAFANGSFGHSLDFEPQGFPRTHGTSSCLPTALALGEEARASGRDIILAYVLGWEVQHRLRAASGRAPGYHPPGLVGPMGGAAAAASVLGLDAEQTRMALGIAATRTGGLTANTGTMTKSTHPGNAARMGAEAGILARAGFTSNPDVLEAPNGYAYALFRGEMEWDLVTGRAGTDFRIVDPGFDIKRFPAQITMQWPIEAVLNLREIHSLSPEEVEHLTLELRSSGHSGPFPISGLDGKFSVEYCAAAALLDGRVNIETFTDERRFAPDMEAMLPRMSVSPWDRNHARATARLRNGRTLSAECIHFRGSVQNPMTREERLDKYRYCAGHALSDQDAERLLGLLERLEAVEDVSTVMDVMRTRAPANA